MTMPTPSLQLIVALALGLPACASAADPPARPGVVQGAAEAALARTLQAHRWTLQSAADSQGRNIDAVAAGPGRSFVFSFERSRISIQGACNRLNGGYQISAAGQMTVGRLAATMKACEAPLMQADAVLSALLASPLKVELSQGTPPSLRLVSAANETLLLAGQATPESLYGAATLIFLEVAAQPVECKSAAGTGSTCLQVRERRFDKQGLPSGKPGEWIPLHDRIEGFTHAPGVRNVLRVKRFKRSPASADGSAYVYVLDLVVESETVSR